MIKRIIGVLFTLVTLAIVVFAVMNYGNYRSMLGIKPANDVATPEEQVEVADSVEVADAIVEASDAVAVR